MKPRRQPITAKYVGIIDSPYDRTTEPGGGKFAPTLAHRRRDQRPPVPRPNLHTSRRMHTRGHRSKPIEAARPRIARSPAVTSASSNTGTRT